MIEQERQIKNVKISFSIILLILEQQVDIKNPIYAQILFLNNKTLILTQILMNNTKIVDQNVKISYTIAIEQVC